MKTPKMNVDLKSNLSSLFIFQMVVSPYEWKIPERDVNNKQNDIKTQYWFALRNMQGIFSIINLLLKNSKGMHSCPPFWGKGGDTKSHLSVSLSILLTASMCICHNKFNLGHNFWMIRDSAFIFHMHITTKLSKYTMIF